jgi:hypothetical protein
MSTVRETEVLDFVAHIIYTTALFLCRLSGLAFYYRLSARYGKLHTSVLVAAPFLFAAYLPQIFLLIFHCRPVTGLWPYEWQSEPIEYKCLSWGLVYSVNSGLSLACDVMMFVIPAILIHQLHVSKKNKIKLSLVMFPGVLLVPAYYSYHLKKAPTNPLQCHRHLSSPRLACRQRPMGLRRQLGLQPHAVRRKRRGRQHPDRTLSPGIEARFRKSLFPSDRVYIQPYPISIRRRPTPDSLQALQAHEWRWFQHARRSTTAELVEDRQ